MQQDNDPKHASKGLNYEEKVQGFRLAKSITRP